jgi:NTP pyrophosphatase (non-canonical NTP hydrolase)
MFTQILDYVKTLSLRDKKNLNEKVLKTVEEVGELAKKALPFSGAYGTRHRFSDQLGILEETADVMLCALSIAYDLGFDDEQIVEMMFKKANKWADVQNKSDQLPDPNKIPFELHLTVSDVEDKEDFRNVCKIAGVKPIFLELETATTNIPDVMTSSKHIGNNQTVMEEMERIAWLLKGYAYTITRKKVETVPWHSMAPQTSGAIMPKDCYFETHIGLAITTAELGKLHELTGANGVHLSRNPFKKLDNDTHVRMCTLRSYTQSREEFNKHRDSFVDLLKANDFNILDIINEFAIYDTNTHHDSAWLAK